MPIECPKKNLADIKERIRIAVSDRRKFELLNPRNPPDVAPSSVKKHIGADLSPLQEHKLRKGIGRGDPESKTLDSIEGKFITENNAKKYAKLKARIAIIRVSPATKRVERVEKVMDYTFPDPKGEGKKISPDENKELDKYITEGKKIYPTSKAIKNKKQYAKQLNAERRDADFSIMGVPTGDKLVRDFLASDKKHPEIKHILQNNDGFHEIIRTAHPDKNKKFLNLQINTVRQNHVNKGDYENDSFGREKGSIFRMFKDTADENGVPDTREDTFEKHFPDYNITLKKQGATPNHPLFQNIEQYTGIRKQNPIQSNIKNKKQFAKQLDAGRFDPPTPNEYDDTPEQARARELITSVQNNRKLQKHMNSEDGRKANKLYVEKGEKINPKENLDKLKRKMAKQLNARNPFSRDPDNPDNAVYDADDETRRKMVDIEHPLLRKNREDKYTPVEIFDDEDSSRQGYHDNMKDIAPSRVTGTSPKDTSELDFKIRQDSEMDDFKPSGRTEEEFAKYYKPISSGPFDKKYLHPDPNSIEEDYEPAFDNGIEAPTPEYYDTQDKTMSTIYNLLEDGKRDDAKILLMQYMPLGDNNPDDMLDYIHERGISDLGSNDIYSISRKNAEKYSKLKQRVAELTDDVVIKRKQNFDPVTGKLKLHNPNEGDGTQAMVTSPKKGNKVVSTGGNKQLEYIKNLQKRMAKLQQRIAFVSSMDRNKKIRDFNFEEHPKGKITFQDEPEKRFINRGKPTHNLFRLKSKTISRDKYEHKSPNGKVQVIESETKRDRDFPYHELKRKLENDYRKTGNKIRPPKPIQEERNGIINAKQRISEALINREHKHHIQFRQAKLGEVGEFKGATQEKYWKYWLLTAKQTNGNNWGVSSDSIDKNIHKFVGRPFCVTAKQWFPESEYETYEHPYLPTNNLDVIFSHQAKYAVGEIVDIIKENGDYYAMIKPHSKFASNSPPPFCSPAIFQLDPHEKENTISKWEALHLAGLDRDPAYGAQIAILKGSCIGTKNECKVQFKSAKQKLASPINQETGEGIDFRYVLPKQPLEGRTYGYHKIPIHPTNTILIRPHKPEHQSELVKHFRKIQNNELGRLTQGSVQSYIPLNHVKNLSTPFGGKLSNHATISLGINQEFKKGDIIMRRAGSDPSKGKGYGQVGDTFYITKNSPKGELFKYESKRPKNSSAYGMKRKLAKLQQRLAVFSETTAGSYFLTPKGEYKGPFESHADYISKFNGKKIKDDDDKEYSKYFKNSGDIRVIHQPYDVTINEIYKHPTGEQMKALRDTERTYPDQIPSYLVSPKLPALESHRELLSYITRNKIAKLQQRLALYQQSPEVNINPAHGKIIADAYDSMKHDPSNPEVQKAYGALINETKSQFKDIMKNGLQLTKSNVSYPTSRAMHDDLKNKKLTYYPTESGYGQEGDKTSDHPMMQPTEFKHNGETLIANDLFRIVHDINGHHQGGESGFGPKGEHQAYLTHKKMYSPLANKALFSETAGQNNWVNFGPYGEHNRKNPSKTVYAEQKAGIFPDSIINGEHHR